MMTKGDFELLAFALCQAFDPEGYKASSKRHVVEVVADVIGLHCPRFNRTKFFLSCGTAAVTLKP